ncbi:SMI1/KNR4 family protein [Peterkaempfera bronchialis]|uniref:SMI1/KNR4 family protein n=1 Tax=Peterkaempfera bronchialis TaxID=2126346 RepID=A0A345SYI1_9ACTN|nr:SMI1/KNR4 family protein [Peterkaempfera bronchialis]AXI78786.1 SMI1/KNR4 family protein [Peterkaempfera bronchialis]
MSDLSDLVRRVRERAVQQAESLPACVTDQDVAAAEGELGFALPTLLGLLYRQVANGGFGPEYTLLPLIGQGRTAVSEYGPLRRAASGYWPRGVLPILDWGCGMYAAVDCLDPAAPVLLFEPNAGPDDWAEAWFLDSPSLAAWLTKWLEGAGWWEEEITLAEDAQEPTPWPDASQRLAADR